MPIATLSRDEFLDDKFDYTPGEHIAIFATTGSGKTVFAHQLADVAMSQNPKLRYVVYQPKEQDESTLEAAAQLDLRIAREYPFRKKLFEGKPRGHVFWPAHLPDDVEADNEYIGKLMNNSMYSEYRKKNVLAYFDDAFQLEGTYGCQRIADRYLQAGRSAGAGLMFAMQAVKGSKSATVSSPHYGCPTHYVFGHENVQANRERYGEIAMGIEPKVIENIVANLRTYKIGKGNVSEFLYLCRNGPSACIVTPN